jgi:hypothetical protein
LAGFLRLLDRGFGVSRGVRLRRRAEGVALAVALVVSVAEGPAAAATFRARDGATLQAALASAGASPGPSTIELSAGTYAPTSTLIVGGDVSIVGPSVGPPARLDGGAVSPFPSDLLQINAHARVTLRNLELTTGGGSGAAAIDNFGAVDLESSTLAGNSGPGLLVQSGATATVRNSTLSDGLDVGMVDLGTASLFNATVAGNANGGIDDRAGTLNLTNSIVAENPSSDCTRRATSSDHSLDGDKSCGVGALEGVNPALGRLAANGGATPTRALTQASPAIDAGDDSRCPSEDQRHFARSDGHCDIGAYEAGAVGNAPMASGRGGPGGSSGSLGNSSRLLGVSAHGLLRGARRSRVAFTVRALVGSARASFLYTDPARHVALRSLTVRSLVVDGRLGVATLRGSCMQMKPRRALGVTIVLTSRAAHRSLRIRLSNGYLKSGAVLNGIIAFTHGRATSARISHGGTLGALVAGDGRPGSRSRGVFEW